MNFIKQTLKSKTAIFGYLITALGLLQANLPDFQAAFAPDTYGLITSGIGFAIIVLRAVTNQPLSDK